MHTVVETPEYLAAAKKAGMSDAERLATVRIARDGKGKSGGYRVVTYYTRDDAPVYLLTVISKGKQANLTTAQKAQIRKGKGK